MILITVAFQVNVPVASKERGPDMLSMLHDEKLLDLKCP